MKTGVSEPRLLGQEREFLMKNKIMSFAFFLAFLLAIVPQVYAQPQVDQSYVARELVFLINENSYEAASEFFHYPESYSSEYKSKEAASVSQGLKKYMEAFGSIIETGGPIPEADYIGVGVSGADISYWEQYNETISQIVVAANFGNVGWGVFRIGFVEGVDMWEIQGVDYSIIATDETRRLVGSLVDQGE